MIGNVLDMPEKEEWETARQWEKKYGVCCLSSRGCPLLIHTSQGPLIHVNNFGTSYVFINSYEMVVELFEKRGNIYSARPQNTMLTLYVYGELSRMR